MKRLLTAFVIIFMLFGHSSAEQKETITYHEAFGLSEKSTGEEIVDAIRETFSTEPNETNSQFFLRNQYFYDIPIGYIVTKTEKPYAKIELVFDSDNLTAKNVFCIYHNFCKEFGEPSVNIITRETNTINGKQQIQVDINNLEEMQMAIDHLSVEGLICWDNISMNFSSKPSSISSVLESKFFEISIAFNEISLKEEVRQLYGINPFRQ